MELVDLEHAVTILHNLNLEHPFKDNQLWLGFGYIGVDTYADDQFRDIVQALGGMRERKATSPAHPPHIVRRIDDDLEIRVYPPSNTELCKKVPTGNKIKERRVVNPDYVEVEIDEYKWNCSPILQEGFNTK